MPAYVLSFLALTLLLASEAAAQNGFGFDPDKETLIDAERVDRFEGGSRLVGEGGVEISQPGVIFKADRVEITVSPETNAIQRLVATGRVRYANVAGDAVAGQRAVYVADETRLTVTGNVVVLQDNQIVTGQELIYNTTTGAMTLTSGPEGRVRGLIADRTPR